MVATRLIITAVCCYFTGGTQQSNGVAFYSKLFVAQRGVIIAHGLIHPTAVDGGIVDDGVHAVRRAGVLSAQTWCYLVVEHVFASTMWEVG